MNSRQIFTLLAFLLTGMMILAACDRNAEEDAPEAEEIVQESISAFDALESARFALDIDGTVPIDADGALALDSVEGELTRPASARVDAGILFAGTRINMELVALEGEMFLRNILTGAWERAPSDLTYDPALVFDAQQGISSILAQVEAPDLTGEESIDGTDTWHVSGEVRTDEVIALTGDFFEVATLLVDLWVAQDDYRLLRVELRENEDQDDADWMLELFDHDEPIEIERPDI